MVLLNPGGSPLVKEVKILNIDGTKEVVTVHDDSPVPYAGGTPLADGKVYSITRTDKGVKFDNPAATIGDYTQIGTPTFGASVADSSTTPTAGTISAVNSTPIADTAKIFIFNATAKDGKVITGKQFKATFKYRDAAETNTEVNRNLTIAYSSTINGLNRTTIAAAVLGGSTVPTVGATDKNYALIVSSGFQLNSEYAVHHLGHHHSGSQGKINNINRLSVTV